MAITPQDIEEMVFSEAKKGGYTTEEVDAFLDHMAEEVDAMLQKIADLKGRLTATEQQLAAAQAQAAQAKEQSMTVAAAPVAVAPANDYSASERQISQVLIVAQQSADKLVADAREAADQIRNEADQKAREVIRQALAEKQNELDEMDRLKTSREEFRAEYKRLLQHFMDDADAVFPEQGLSMPTGNVTVEPAAPVSAPVQEIPAYTPPVSGGIDFSDLD